MERDLSDIVDSLPGLVWTALPDGHVEFVNRRWCEYTGLSVAQSSGRGWQAAIHTEDLPELLERWRASGESRGVEARVRRFDGEWRWFLLRMRPLVDAPSQAGKRCGVAIRIGGRQQGQEPLGTRWWLSSLGRELQFRTIADSIPALAALLIPGGGIELVNRRTLEYFGKTLEELRVSAISNIHPDDQQHVTAVTRGPAVDAGIPYDFEARLRRVDGAYRWFHTTGFPLRDSEGHIVFWYLLQTDIDDRKRAEALLAGEKRLLEMVARGHSLPVVLDALCRLTEEAIDGGHCGIFQLSTSGSRLQAAAAPNLPEGFVESVQALPVAVDSGPVAMAACENAQVISHDLASDRRWEASGWRRLALNKGLRSCWSIPIPSRSGRVLGVLAILFREPGTPTPHHDDLVERFTDLAGLILDRARSEDALRRNEAFLMEAQRLSSTGSFAWHVATNTVTWSEQVYRIWEIDPTIPVTIEVSDSRIHPEDLPSLYEKVNWARQQGKDFEHGYRLLMPDQSIKYVHTVFHEGQDPDGELEFIGAIQDVTQRRLSEEALARARSEFARVARVTTLGALTASIAHEVNQPLSGIITNASTCLRMLATQPPNVDGAQETARRTIRDANRASDVITRLRALFSQKVANVESLDLSEITRDVIALSLSELQRNRVILHPELSDGLPRIEGDRVQLQQVILNLFMNASEAMSSVEDRPRELVVRTERDDDDRVRLTVQDSGVGFEEKVAERLFEAFYTTKASGMGIGLSVSRSIIESHHGRLWAGPNDGPGAMFSFSIPCASEARRVVTT